MSKAIKSKLVNIRIVFYVLLSLLSFLLGFATSDKQFAAKKGRRDIILELRIKPMDSRTNSRIYTTLSNQESKGENYYE